jgi:hypothetical protein
VVRDQDITTRATLCPSQTVRPSALSAPTGTSTSMAEQGFEPPLGGRILPSSYDTQKSAPRFTFFSAICGTYVNRPALIAPQEIIFHAQLEHFDQFLLQAVVQQADLLGL